MIVFGWNSFKLHHCKPSQLGLPEDMDKLFTIERRQKYFHLFWIPFFGIGKFWAMRKLQDDQLYDPSAELNKFFESLPLQHKTPWYTFTLFWLMLAGSGIYFISEQVDSYNRKRQHERYVTERNAAMKSAIGNFQEGTYFKMRNPETYKASYFKPVRHDANFLVCVFAEQKDDQRYSSNEILEAFAPDSTRASFDTLKISKEDLIRTINADDAYSFKGFEVVRGKGNMVFDEMKVVQFPVLRHVVMQYAEGRFLALMQNIGASGKIKDYNSAVSNIEFTTPILSEEIKSGTIFPIEGAYTGVEPSLNATIIMESLRDSTTQFEFNIHGPYVTLQQRL